MAGGADGVLGGALRTAGGVDGALRIAGAGALNDGRAGSERMLGGVATELAGVEDRGDSLRTDPGKVVFAGAVEAIDAGGVAMLRVRPLSVWLKGCVRCGREIGVDPAGRLITEDGFSVVAIVSLVITIDRGGSALCGVAGSFRGTVLSIVEADSFLGGRGVTFLPPMEPTDREDASALLPREELFSEMDRGPDTDCRFGGSDLTGGVSTASVFTTGALPPPCEVTDFGSLRGGIVLVSPRCCGVGDETVVEFAAGSANVEVGADCLRPPGEPVPPFSRLTSSRGGTEATLPSTGRRGRVTVKDEPLPSILSPRLDRPVGAGASTRRALGTSRRLNCDTRSRPGPALMMVLFWTVILLTTVACL